MLSEKNIEESVDWEAAQKVLTEDERFTAAPSEEAQKQWYMDYLETCALEGEPSLQLEWVK